MFEQEPPAGNCRGFSFAFPKRPLAVATIPFPRRLRRLSLRYYLWDGYALSWLPNRLHSAPLLGETALMQFAASRKKRLRSERSAKATGVGHPDMFGNRRQCYGC